MYKQYITAAIFAVATLLSNGCASASLQRVPQFITSEHLWVKHLNDSSLVGKVDISTGEVQWHQLDLALKNTYTFIQSSDNHYLASRTASGVVIYKVLNQDKVDGALMKVAEINGYENPQWSPNTNELLLLPTSGNSVVIWRPEDGNLPNERIVANRHVCSATWGQDTDTLILSICTGQRELIRWSRKTVTPTTLLHFNLKMPDGQYAVYTSILQSSPDRRFVLLKLHIWTTDVHDDNHMPSVLIDEQHAVANIQTGEIKVLGAKIFVGSSYIMFLSDHEVLSAGQYDLNLPPKFTYILSDINTDQAKFLWTNDQNCLQDMIMIKEKPILQYRSCQDGSLEGFYEVAIQSSQRSHIPVQNSEQKLIIVNTE